MTPQEFVKAWLPNYEIRLQEWRYGHSRIERCNLTEGTFIRNNFDGALAAFALQQRLICEQEAHDVYGKGWWDTNLSDAIALAPMPTPKNK